MKTIPHICVTLHARAKEAASDYRTLSKGYLPMSECMVMLVNFVVQGSTLYKLRVSEMSLEKVIFGSDELPCIKLRRIDFPTQKDGWFELRFSSISMKPEEFEQFLVFMSTLLLGTCPEIMSNEARAFAEGLTAKQRALPRK